MDALLKFDTVDISYGELDVVHNVNFSLHAGEVLGIVGESGSGKSTIIKAAMGLLGNYGVVSRGDIWLEGRNVPDLSQKELQQIRGEKMGMIFQDAGASLCPIRTIGAQIYESMRAHKRRISKKEAKEEALRLFEKLNFKDGERIWKSYPFELSGGMNQRVGIAMAMLLNPPILLADEPTSALDAVSQKQVVQEMLRVRELFDTAIILVTHDMEVVSAMADTIMVLKDGEVMEFGPAKQVLETPKNAYTKELMAAVPKIRRS